MNSLVVCGGTGAHIALAMVRLHTLGYALGFFRQTQSEALQFPTLYLVDQDSGDGEGESTAWQEVHRLIHNHPGRNDWLTSFGRSTRPPLRVVTPLPVGSDRTWFDPPYVSLGRRFNDSSNLRLLTSHEQRNIEYSLGMMGSPAVGALLFRLKQFDKTPGGANHENEYQELLNEQGRVVVAGSAVGGTGASVAPTLALQLADAGADVMAVMVLNWFRFDTDGLDEEALGRVQRRTQSMIENANSAFAYYGRDLARHVATVPVGMPRTAVGSRRYTSDTRQPISESFIHGVAALCCLNHFLSQTAFDSGLYQMGAEAPAALHGGTRLPGGDTLQSLANHAATLAEALKVYAHVLSTSNSRGWFGRLFDVDPAIRSQLDRSDSDLEKTGECLGKLAAEYRKHVDWIRDVLGTDPKADDDLLQEILLREREARARIVKCPIEGTGRRQNPPEDDALALFHWTAEWIHGQDEGKSGAVASAVGGYWPPLVGQGSLTVSANQAGGLTRVPDQNVQSTVQGFISNDKVTHNGWPHPLAAAEHFRYAIEQGNLTARRQLAMLLVGVVSEILELRESSRLQGLRSGPSLESLVEEYRQAHSRDFASFEVVYKSSDREVILGFNSPHTILCPVPGLDSDDTLARIWAKLSATLTNSQQPSDWNAEEMDRWRPFSRSIHQIRSWIDGEKKQRGETSPPWTSVFEGSIERMPFGMGQRLSVYWGTGDRKKLIEVHLPTARPGKFWPYEGMKLIDEQELLKSVPKIRTLEDPQTHQIAFEMVDFELPDHDQPVRAIWRDHLEQLQMEGIIKEFGERQEERRIAVLVASRTAAILDRAIILDRERIMVRECCPMRQEPVSGLLHTGMAVRYPDYPLRADYLDLVQLDDGQNLLEIMKRGERFRVPKPTIDDRPNERFAIWAMRFRGRNDKLSIKLPLTKDGELHKAHWMVWPRFRSKTSPAWRAYYVYEHCTDARVHPDMLWHDPDSGQVRRSKAGDQKHGSRPIQFVAGDRRSHTGGPPLALCAKNAATERELGLYIIQLDSLARRDGNVKVGIDFGTSHTIASVQADGEKHLVELAPELGSPEDALTLHVSEDLSHVNDKDEGLLKSSTWLPTYVRDTVSRATGLLPSELLAIQTLESLTGSDVGQWLPGRDCVIPCTGIGRRDLADHLLSDFKWDCSYHAFRGSEPVLREIYLGMVTELVMADICWRQLRALPERKVAFTFTYPLRTQTEQVKSFEKTLRRVMASGTRSCGIELGLTDQVGIYNESSAAKGGTNNFGEVCLVADLGGGTLDILISANAAPGVEFEEVADSAKLGGNELLRMLAKDSNRFLPKNAGWGNNPREIETKLRAWMRTHGSSSLFGLTADGTVLHEGFNMRGFEKPADANEARAFISRYFGLLTEYLARSLVAFLTRHWYGRVRQSGHDPGALRVLVELRGNGWRLRYDADDYRRLEASLAKDIERRTKTLWEQADLWQETGIAQAVAPACNEGGSSTLDPKAAPILAAVGKSLEHERIRSLTHSYALVDLHLLHARQAAGQPDRIRWYDRLPFRHRGGVNDLQVEFRGIEPPIPLSHPEAAHPINLADLETRLKRHVNENLRDLGTKGSGVDYWAPIAPLVWEAAFRSQEILRARGK